MYVVSMNRAPYERHVVTIADAAALLGPAGQSRNVSRKLTTDDGNFAGLAPLTEAERLAFLRAQDPINGAPIGSTWTPHQDAQAEAEHDRAAHAANRIAERIADELRGSNLDTETVLSLALDAARNMLADL